MKCVMCLEDTAHYLEIFDSMGIKLQISQIVAKHFWFEPKESYGLSSIICQVCWKQIENFHNYYRAIELTHGIQQKILENLSVQREETHETKFISTTNNDDKESKTYFELTDIKEEQNTNEIDSNGKVQNIQDEDHTKFCPSFQTASEDDDYTDINNCDNLNKENPKKVKKVYKKLQKNENKGYARGQKEGNKESKSARKFREYDERIATFMKLKCELCALEYIKFSELSRHFQSVHNQTAYVICCNRKFSRRNELLDHVNKHLNPEDYKCFECDKLFSDKQCLKNHKLKMHYTEKDIIFGCDLCSRKFAKRSLLERHKSIHIPPEKRNFFCNECGKAFPSKNKLSIHVKGVHGDAYKLICDICAKVIKGKSLFEKHMLEHSGIIEPKVQCAECGSCMKQDSLRKHRRCHLLGAQICIICGKSLASTRVLRNHMRFVHSSERAFKCNICTKAFKKSLSLKEHMTTHTGEILYTCANCPKTFNSSANMHSHRKKMHKNEWEETRKQRSMPIVNTKDNNAINSTKPTEELIKKENTNNAESNLPTHFTGSI